METISIIDRNFNEICGSFVSFVQCTNLIYVKYYVVEQEKLLFQIKFKKTWIALFSEKFKIGVNENILSKVSKDTVLFNLEPGRQNPG